jgi:hypothetical protein
MVKCWLYLSQPNQSSVPKVAALISHVTLALNQSSQDQSPMGTSGSVVALDTDLILCSALPRSVAC